MDTKKLDEINEIKKQIDNIDAFLRKSRSTYHFTLKIKDKIISLFNSNYHADELRLPVEFNDKIIKCLEDYRNKLEKQFKWWLHTWFNGIVYNFSKISS